MRQQRSRRAWIEADGKRTISTRWHLITGRGESKDKRSLIHLEGSTSSLGPQGRAWVGRLAPAEPRLSANTTTVQQVAHVLVGVHSFSFKQLAVSMFAGSCVAKHLDFFFLFRCFFQIKNVREMDLFLRMRL